MKLVARSLDDTWTAENKNCRQCSKTRLSANTENITIPIDSITYIDVRRTILYKYKKAVTG